MRLLGRDLAHRVVEARDPDPAVGPLQRCDDLGEFGDDRSYQDTGGADAFVVAGLGGHVGEHLTQVGSGMAYPSGLGIELHQLLGDDQAQ